MIVERKELERTAGSYWYLRGLLLVPIGGLIFAAALTNLGWGPLGDVWIFALAAVVAASACWRITRYYRDRYGRVTPARRGQVRGAVLTVVGAIAVIGGGEIDWSLDLPINATAAAFALVMLGYNASTVGIRAHHLVIWGGLLAVSLAPVWGGLAGGDKSNVGLLVIGAATCLTGLVDHAVLERSLADAGA